MRLLILLLGLLAGACLPAFADGQLLQEFPIDLNRDGRREVVALKAFTQDGVTLGQLVVLDHRGNVLWAGPKRSAVPQSPSEPLVFGGEFDLGDLEIVSDLDGDGAVEILGTYQKSDVSPTRFRMLRWKGNRFVHVRSGALVPAPQRPGTFVWRQGAPEASTWLERFVAPRGDRSLQVKITDLRGEAPGEPIDEVVRCTAEGFQIAR